jgi:uncharacterized protein YjbI with pentapeptide repeats
MATRISIEDLISGYKSRGSYNTGIVIYAPHGWNSDWESSCKFNLQSIYLAGAELEEGLNLGGSSLKGANFRGAQLAHVWFKGSDLTSADFNGASLNKTEFQGAKLEGATFRGAFIEETNFSGADLTGADLTGADGIDLAYLDGTIFNETIMPDGSIRTDLA